LIDIASFLLSPPGLSLEALRAIKDGQSSTQFPVGNVLRNLSKSLHCVCDLKNTNSGIASPHLICRYLTLAFIYLQIPSFQ
jgi:hypothetical protein